MMNKSRWVSLITPGMERFYKAQRAIEDAYLFFTENKHKITNWQILQLDEAIRALNTFPRGQHLLLFTSASFRR
ncbi:MAG TPA: hypothetical protein VGU44_03565 [Gammaproteobacteria bacterium]|nr:hypothetical protein [Gammaproteobacteria bacterium]